MDDPSVPGPDEGPDETISLGSYTSGGTRYRVVSLLGRGGVGEVWLARDVELNRDVALKQLRGRFKDHADSRRRFLREVRATAALEHPGIVPVYDIGRHPDGRLFQVMRLFERGTLHRLVRDYHRDHPRAVDELAFRTLLGHFTAACRAVASAHAREVIHLDLKPANVVTGAFGETQVIDWGMAWLKGQAIWEQVSEESGSVVSGAADDSGSGTSPPMTEPRGFRGTPAYAAPEQYRGRWDAIGPHTDVYGLGATLYEILAGAPPFDTSLPTLPEDVEAGHLHRPARPWAPSALVAIAKKAMAPDPARRYPGALDLAADVERFLADEPVAAYPDPWQVRTWRWVKRHRTAVAAAAALLATSAVALGLGYAVVSLERDRAVVAEGIASDERDRALAAEDEARRQAGIALANAAATRGVIAGFVESVADERWARVPGTAELRLDAVRKVLDEYPALIEQQPDDLQLQLDAASLDRSCANLFRTLGRLGEARALYDRARAAMEDLVRRDPKRVSFRESLALLLLDIGEHEARTVGPERAIPTYREALGQAEAAVAAAPESRIMGRTVAQVRIDLASALGDAGRIGEAVRLAGEAVAGFAAEVASDGEDDESTRATTRLLAALASVIDARVRIEAGDAAGARAAADEADRASGDLAAAYPGIPDIDYVRACALLEKGLVLGREPAAAAESAALLERAHAELGRLAVGPLGVASFVPSFARAACARGEAALAAGDPAAAAGLAEEAIREVTPLDAPADAAGAKRLLAAAHSLRSRAAAALGDAAAAEHHRARAAECYAVAVAAAPANDAVRAEAARMGPPAGK